MEWTAVQEERQRNKDKNENEVESTSSNNNDMPIERILDSELRVEPKNLEEIDANVSSWPWRLKLSSFAAIPLLANMADMTQNGYCLQLHFWKSH